MALVLEGAFADDGRGGVFGAKEELRGAEGASSGGQGGATEERAAIHGGGMGLSSGQDRLRKSMMGGNTRSGKHGVQRRPAPVQDKKMDPVWCRSRKRMQANGLPCGRPLA
jgi:hypothetical protein